jgi:predicted small metal-binding protein
MAKILRCKDAGFDCAGEIRGQTEEEVLQKAAEHAKKVHNTDVTPAMAAQIRPLIKDE